MDLEEIYKTYTKYDPESLRYPKRKNSNRKILYLENEDNSEKKLNLRLKFPEMETECLKSSLKSLKLLNENENNDSDNDNERNIFEAWFEFKSEKEIQILPGDSFGFLIGNFNEEVKELVKFLHVSEYENFIVKYLNSKKRNMPEDTVSRILKYYVDLRAIPNKKWIYEISFYCKDEKVRKCLMFLSCKEGSKLYDKYILKQHLSKMDLMKYFQVRWFCYKSFLIDSIEFKPRYYYIIDYKVEKKEVYEYQIKIAFSVTHLPQILNRENTHLLGIFTGTMQQRYFLENRIKLKKNDSESTSTSNQIIDNEKKTDTSFKNLSNSFSNLNLDQVYYLFKSNKSVFKMAYKLYSNTILVSINTGIAPFLSFFKYLKKNKILSLNIWLIHGCRNEENCLYLDELIEYEESKLINKLQLCYSNSTENTEIKYVRDYIKQEEKLKDFIENEDTVIYVCGDDKKFKKDVWDAFLHINDDNFEILKEMQKQKRYLQNVWD